MTKEQRHKCMSRIRGKDTKPEIMLRKHLWHLGIRYRKNYKKLPGTPDIAITRFRIAVFVDGDFWHGRDMERVEKRLQTHREYWLAKLKKNRARDKAVNEALTEEGWLVLRFWGSDILKNLEECVHMVSSYMPPSNK